MEQVLGWRLGIL